MALVLKDRVKETTTTAGTGAVTLAGAAAGFDSFSVIGNANTTYYAIVAQTPGEWEVGLGTYTSSGTSLSRDTVLANSAGTQPSALSFSAGVKDVFVTYPADAAVVASNNPGAAGQALISQGPNTAAIWTAIGTTPVGALQYFAGDTTTTYPGSDWLACNGAIVSQATYPELFSTIGFVADNISTWTTRTSGTASAIFALTYGNGLYVYAGNNGVLATSTNAITWTTRTSGTASAINALIYNDGLYVYADAGGVVSTSTDAITWTARTSGTTSGIKALTYGNGLYVYAGFGGVLGTSTDAITWTTRTSGTTSTINALTYGNGLYVYAGGGGVLATSADAITWTARTSGTISNLTSLIYANGIYMVTGASNQTTRISANGIGWTTRISGSLSSSSAQTYGNGVYVQAGSASIATASAFTYNSSADFAIPAYGEDLLINTTYKLFIKAQ